jgi:acyl carrier protein
MASGSTVPEKTMTVAAALDWIAETFEEPKGQITATTARSDIAAWDSLGQLLLMSGLDQQFGIRLTQAELSSLTSVQNILDILTKHQRVQQG